MLYYIFRFLEQYNIPGAHIWSYISFRSLLALILSLLISAWFGEYFIKWMKRRNISETARDASIDPFGVEKKGVPTMGGIIIIVSILIPVLLLGRMRNIYLLLMIVTTVWLGFLGFMDDYIKIFKKNKEGLKGLYKIIGQVSIGFIVGFTLWLSPDAVVRENVTETQQNQEVVIKHKTKPDHHPLYQESQPELLLHHVVLWQVQGSSRLDSVRHHDHYRCHGGIEWC